MKWIKGSVRWFDDITGDGVVCDDKGKRYYVYYTSIPNKMSLKRGDQIEFTKLDICYRDQVDKIKERTK